MAVAGNTSTPPEEKGIDVLSGCCLPEEVIVEILKRLRTGCCIGRSRCVNKAWYRMLSDPNFIGQIIFFSNTHDEKAANIMVTGERNNDGRIAYSVLSSHQSSTWSSCSSGSIFPELNRNPEIVGCCDGIFCLYEKVKIGDNPSFARITLWNPTTCETKVLPEHEVPPHSYETQVGFGFDPQTNDYKVIVGRSYSHLENIGCIYSLRNDSWRRLESWIHTPNSRYIYNVTQPHSSRMDKVYWVWRPISEWKFMWTDYFYICCFDMAKEVTSEINILDYPGPYYLAVGPTFSVVKESVIVITYGEELLDLPTSRIRHEDSSSDEEDNKYYNKSGEYTVYTIWGMLGNEQLNFGSDRTWTKLFTVSLDYPFKAIHGVWVNGGCFVVDTEQRLHINNKSSIPKRADVVLNIGGGCSSSCEVTTFVPSTISLSFSSLS